MNKLLRKYGILFIAIAMMTLQSLPVMADDSKVNRYIIGTADDEFGMFPFPPWDVIDPATGENIGLNGQFVRAIAAANKRMKVKLRPVRYSDCGELSDPFFLGDKLAKGVLDGCSSWAQTSRRRQAGASFAVAVQSNDYSMEPYALMLNEESLKRRNKSAKLRLDANCGAALIAAASELREGQDLTLPYASNSSESDTDFQDFACGQLVPTSVGSYQDFSDLCARDREIALPTLQCLEANGL